MFDAHLRRPGPQIPDIGKRGDRQGRERSGGQRGKKQTVLAGDDGSIGPVQPHDRGAHSNEPHPRAVRSIRKSSGEIKIHVGAGARAGDIRTEGLKPDLRLAKRSAKRSRRSIRLVGLLRFGDLREIQVVHGPAILKQIQQDDAGKPQPVLRSAFDLGLVLVVDFAFHDLLVFFQFGDAILAASAIVAALEKSLTACRTDSLGEVAEYGLSGPLAAGAPCAFTRSNSRRSSRASALARSCSVRRSPSCELSVCTWACRSRIRSESARTSAGASEAR